MDQSNHPEYPEYPDYTYGTTPPPEPQLPNPAGRRELILAFFALVFCMLLANSVFAGGFDLGYGLAFAAIVVTSMVYLGNRLHWNAWGIFHLICTLAMAGIFAYSSDASTKFLVFYVMQYAWYQALAQLSGAASREPGSVTTIADAASVLFTHSFSGMGSNLRGLGYMRTEDGLQRRKTGAVLIGLALSVPVLLVVIPLLMASDAAFEGLMDKTIFFDSQSMVFTIILGTLLFLPLFCRNLNLRRQTRHEAAGQTGYSGRASAMTINTILTMVSIFYLLYLVSQLAYFFSAFSGILPEGFTSAEYARRGFFEMCALCAINLGLLALCLALVQRKDGRVPMGTRFLSIFICFFCLVLVAASASKMGLYIQSFGLTRLRLLTSIFNLCLAAAIVCVGIWLLKPRFPYMKVIVATVFLAVIITGWMDVDTQVARYNVRAYQSGQLDSIDLDTLEYLSAGSTSYLVELLDDTDQAVSEQAKEILARRLDDYYTWKENEDGTLRFLLRDVDIRSWNYKTQQEIDALEPVAYRLIDKLVALGYMDSSVVEVTEPERP